MHFGAMKLSALESGEDTIKSLPSSNSVVKIMQQKVPK
jgi:hypothetical protein